MSNERNLTVPRPNSVRDPIRLGTSVERDVGESLAQFAKADHRSLSDYLRVLLTKYVEDKRAEPVPQEVEARYSTQ